MSMSIDPEGLKGQQLQDWIDRAWRVRECPNYSVDPGPRGVSQALYDGPADLDACPTCRQTMCNHIDTCELCYIREEGSYEYSRSVASLERADESIQQPADQDQD